MKPGKSHPRPGPGHRSSHRAARLATEKRHKIAPVAAAEVCFPGNMLHDDNIMHNLKTAVAFSLAGVLAGALFGAAPYWTDIKREVTPDRSPVSWEQGEIDREVMADTASLAQLLELSPPADNAPDEKWNAFLVELRQTDIGGRNRHNGVNNPLLPWYAYIARHRPEVLYRNLGTREFDTSKFDHLLKMGMLGDWHLHVSRPDELLIGNSSALQALARTHGTDTAREKVIEAFFRLARQPEGTYQLRPENLRFAAPALSPAQRRILLDTLLTGPFRLDPREVRRLALLDEMDPHKLRALIRKFSYPEKSMSSYMITAAQLGEKEYVGILAADAPDNAKQPTNFYCSVCGLALASDGLIGEPLAEAVSEGLLQVTPSEQYGFILSRSERGQMFAESRR